MSTTASLTIRKNRTGQLYTIVIEVIHNRKNSSISTSIFIDEKSWDSAKSKIKASCNLYDNVTLVNSIILDKLKVTHDKILELEKKGLLQFMSLKSLMNYLNPRRTGISVVQALKQRQATLLAANQTGLAKTCLNAANMLKNTYNNDITFSQLTTSKLDAIILLYRTKNHKTGGNGIKPYIAQIKRIYNELLLEHKVDENKDLETYTIKLHKTVKRAIDLSFIQKIVSLNYNAGTHKYHCRNMLIFMYLQGGINIKDLLLLTPENINNGRLVYVRRKTKRLYDQPLAKRSIEILKEYTNGKASDDYIFPILDKAITTEPEFSKHYEYRYQYINTLIKEIGREIGLSIKLTSYVTRHSFASHARNANVSLYKIQAALGHESSKTTEIYLSEVDTALSDEAFNVIENKLG